MKSIVVDMAAVVDATHTSRSGNQQQLSVKSITKQASSIPSARMPEISTSSSHSDPRSVASRNSAASQKSEMRRLLQQERSHHIMSPTPAAVLVRSHRCDVKTPDSLSTMEQSATTHVLLQRLARAEEQTRRFQHDIQALTNRLIGKDDNMIQAVTPPSQVKASLSKPLALTEQQERPVVEQTSTKEQEQASTESTSQQPLYWQWAQQVRQRLSLDSNSILEERGVDVKGATVSNEPKDENNNDETTTNDESKKNPNPCSALEPYIELLREYVGLPNPSETSVVGLKVPQFKKDQMTKQKFRDLEKENLQLRRTLQVVQVKFPGDSNDLKPQHRSCPGRMVGQFATHKEQDDIAEEGPQICLAASKAESIATLDAILSLSTHDSSSVTHSSSVTVRPTKTTTTPPPSTTTSSSVAQASQVSHDSRLVSVPENEELSTNMTTPPSPSEHNASSPARKYCLKELRERSKLLRRSSSRSPPEAREPPAGKKLNHGWRSKTTKRFRIRGSKQYGADALEESKWRMSFLERVEV